MPTKGPKWEVNDRVIQWSPEERRIIEALAVDACAAGSCDTGTVYIKLLIADRAWRIYGERTDFDRLQALDLRDMVLNEAWKGSEILEERICELAHSLTTDRSRQGY